MEVALLLAVGVEAVKEHGKHAEDEGGRGEGVGHCAGEAEAADDGGEEVCDGADDVGLWLVLVVS